MRSATGSSTPETARQEEEDVKGGKRKLGTGLQLLCGSCSRRPGLLETEKPRAVGEVGSSHPWGSRAHLPKAIHPASVISPVVFDMPV